jgi:hypothetical protein
MMFDAGDQHADGAEKRDHDSRFLAQMRRGSIHGPEISGDSPCSEPGRGA